MLEGNYDKSYDFKPISCIIIFNMVQNIAIYRLFLILCRIYTYYRKIEQVIVILAFKKKAELPLDNDKEERIIYNRKYSELIIQIAENHSKSAFAEVFKEFYPRVKSYLSSLSVDYERVDDVTQDVMTTIWRKANQYDATKAAPVTWIFTIARNRYIDVCIRKKNHKFSEEDAGFFMIDLEEPDVSLARVQNQEVVQDVIEKLPDTHIELVKMAYFRDYSHREISEKTGLPLGTVKSRLRVALQKMRKFLGKNYDF